MIIYANESMPDIRFRRLQAVCRAWGFDLERKPGQRYELDVDPKKNNDIMANQFLAAVENVNRGFEILEALAMEPVKSGDRKKH
jgi:hypothetical protein